MALYFNRGRNSPYTFERLQASQAQVPSQSSIRSRFQGPIEPLDIDGGLGGLDTPGNQESLGSSLRRPGGITNSGLRDPGGRDRDSEALGKLGPEEAAERAEVSNASFAEDVVSGLPGKGFSIAGEVVGGLTDALGPYGVTGFGGTSPPVGTPAFDQATPSADSLAGTPDRGAQAAAMSSDDVFGAAAYGGSAPVPDTFGQPKSVNDIGMRGLSQIGSSISNALGLDSSPGGVGDNVSPNRGGGRSVGGPPSGPTGIGGIGNNTTSVDASATGPGGMASDGRAGPTGGEGNDGDDSGVSTGGHTGPDGPAGSGMGAF